jgi:hypothetical protein
MLEPGLFRGPVVQAQNAFSTAEILFDLLFGPCKPIKFDELKDARERGGLVTIGVQ